MEIFQPSLSVDSLSTVALSSPTTTIDSLTKEFENSLDSLPLKSERNTGSSNGHKSNSIPVGNSLDIRQISNGQFVVKPQDNGRIRPEIVTLNECGKPSEDNEHDSGASINRNSIGHYSLGSHRYIFIAGFC